MEEQTTSVEGVKFDHGKPAMHLIPPEALTAMATVLTIGAEKYSARNWEQGMAWSRVYGALLRHLNAWWGGESCDPETGRSHLDHALTCLAFLVAYEARGPLQSYDDRPYAPAANAISGRI